MTAMKKTATLATCMKSSCRWWRGKSWRRRVSNQSGAALEGFLGRAPAAGAGFVAAGPTEAPSAWGLPQKRQKRASPSIGLPQARQKVGAVALAGSWLAKAAQL